MCVSKLFSVDFLRLFFFVCLIDRDLRHLVRQSELSANAFSQYRTTWPWFSLVRTKDNLFLPDHRCERHAKDLQDRPSLKKSSCCGPETVVLLETLYHVYISCWIFMFLHIFLFAMQFVNTLHFVFVLVKYRYKYYKPESRWWRFRCDLFWRCQFLSL